MTLLPGDMPRDLLVIGAGLAGITAATAAARQGYSVTLISALDRHPPDFRGEKFGEAQMAVFDRAGLGETARRQATAFDGVFSYQFGRLTERSNVREYSSDYAGLVNALGDALPAEITRITGRIADIATTADLQTVTLNDGRVFTGRLLAIATGLGDAVRRMLGIERMVLSAAHSLSVGFDIEEPAEAFDFPSIVWGREADRLLSYLTIFPIGDRMRGNLFVYRNAAEDWTHNFRADPQAAMAEAMPALTARLGPMTIKPGLAVRPIDIVETTNTRHDGVVLLGDAYSVVCPITGMGMAKALNDADLLANVHLPAWLASPGMNAAKISSFYADPAKTELDQQALRDSLLGREHATGESLYWRTRRFGSIALSRLRSAIYVATDAPATATPRLAAARRIG